MKSAKKRNTARFCGVCIGIKMCESNFHKKTTTTRTTSTNYNETDVTKKVKMFFWGRGRGWGATDGEIHETWGMKLATLVRFFKKKFSDVVLFLTVFLSSCELTSPRIISDKTDTKIEWNPVLKMSLLENTNQIAKWLVEEDFGVTTFLPQRIAGSVCMYDN